jgi:iron complex outermembrane receptor protein
MKYRIAALCTVASGVATGQTPPATAITQPEAQPSAQSAAAPAAPDLAGDIVVTARKRQESILKVPVVETALTAAQLERTQTTNLNDLATRVPGLILGQAVLSIGTQVSIRGVGTSSLDSGVDQSISLNIDGLQLSQGLAYGVGTFDLGQAEILKGPQALFFGKSSPGGVISLRTADPGSQAEIVSRASYEVYSNQYRVEHIVSGPISDTFLVRLAGMYSHDNGYFRNTAVASPGFGGVTPTFRHLPTEHFIVRPTFVWKPDPSLSARLKINVARDRVAGSGGDGQMASCPDGTGRNPLGIPFLGADESCRADRNLNVVWLNPALFQGVRNGGVPFTQLWQHFGTFELNYVPADALTITSVTGYYHAQQDSLLNAVETTDAAPPISADNHFRRNDLTQEVRLNSDYGGPLNFTLGGFYQDSTVRNRILILGDTGLGLPAQITNGTHKLGIRSYSLFGQARYKLTPTLELAAGLRWTHERRSDLVTSYLTGGPVQLDLPTPSIKAVNYSPEVTLTWTPTDDLTAFGSFKQAYKSGSYSITTIPAPGVDNSFGDEKVQGGEIGLKGRALDRRLTANVAGYYYHYTGLQVGANEPAQNGVPIVRTINAGSANFYGVDFDANYRPPDIDGLDLHAGANWNHAKFTKLLNAPCIGGQSVAQGCNLLVNPATGAFTAQDLSGSRPVRAPRWQVSFGLDYDLPLPNGMKLSFSSNNSYSSRYLTNLLARADMYQRAYVLADATLALRGRDDHWEVAAIGNNLSNKLYTGNCTNFNAEAGQVLGGQTTGTTLPPGPAGVDELTCQYNRGRAVYLRLTLRPVGLFR